VRQKQKAATRTAATSSALLRTQNAEPQVTFGFPSRGTGLVFLGYLPHEPWLTRFPPDLSGVLPCRPPSSGQSPYLSAGSRFPESYNSVPRLLASALQPNARAGTHQPLEALRHYTSTSCAGCQYPSNAGRRKTRPFAELPTICGTSAYHEALRAVGEIEFLGFQKLTQRSKLVERRPAPAPSPVRYSRPLRYL